MSFAPDRSRRATSLLRDRRGWLGLAVLAIALGAFLVVRARHGESEAEDTPIVTAETALARVADFPVTIAVLGTVVPGPGAEARPAAPAPTRVTGVLVAEGDAVRAGQPLVALDVAVFQAQLEQAQAALAAAAESRRRLERLVGQGIAPRKELEAAAAEEAQARAALAEAQHNQELGTVRSPIAGIVTEVAVAVGQPVEANQPLVHVVDPAGLAIVLRLAPDDAGRVAPGADVALSTTDAAGAAGGAGLGNGTVIGISGAVDATGSVAARVAAPRTARRLLAGESVTGRITIGVHRHVVVVPVTALVPGDEGVHVFVVAADSIAHETPVVVGERSDTDAEILSGLRGGERVVTAGAYGVSAGARIRGPGQ